MVFNYLIIDDSEGLKLQLGPVSLRTRGGLI